MQPYAEILSRDCRIGLEQWNRFNLLQTLGWRGWYWKRSVARSGGTMFSSTFWILCRCPLPQHFNLVPEELAGQLSQGYAFELGKHVEKPFEYVPLGAAGGMSASALAMTRFARAHLGDGSVDGQRILSGESVALMLCSMNMKVLIPGFMVLITTREVTLLSMDTVAELFDSSRNLSWYRNTISVFLSRPIPLWVSG